MKTTVNETTEKPRRPRLTYAEMFSEPTSFYGEGTTILVKGELTQAEAFAAMQTDYPHYMKNKTAEDLTVEWVRFGIYNDSDGPHNCWNFGQYNENTRGAKKVWACEV